GYANPNHDYPNHDNPNHDYPHQGYPNQGYPNPPQGHPGPQGYGPTGDPMRLRPPSPAGGAGAFQQPRGGNLKWLWIVLGLVVVAGLVVGAIFLFGGDGSGGGTTTPTTAPNIPVGPGGSQSSVPSSSLNAPPTSIPIQPSP
ncbi:MAG TPA: serine/threonine protein kinase, partial [Amycolatopsis sp.]|nr:serine/threonine protein kinase [Amycolatopsis sp.]